MRNLSTKLESVAAVSPRNQVVQDAGRAGFVMQQIAPHGNESHPEVDLRRRFVACRSRDLGQMVYEGSVVRNFASPEVQISVVKIVEQIRSERVVPVHPDYPRTNLASIRK